MVDFHSHILPGMDDGSQSPEESLQLLLALKAQGVDTVAATSHYYARREAPESFLQRREEALARLPVPEGMRILPGAEVRYYEGIGRLSQLRQLCIGPSNVLLLEMPEERWTEHMVQEILHMAGSLQVVIAHIERPAPMQSPQTLLRLCQRGVLLQSNADFFTGTFSRWKACRMVSRGLIHVLGSDCHNLTTRPPRLASACRVIARRFGPDALARMQALGYRLLQAD